ncbi:hypothetical protein JQX13_03895 [Archangium violaceum]|uniref:thioesterase domain-containing protein n=1 Tax=Archangium violaceum TaxID=83451 RepID=UPI00193C0278|nr:thioesterase domain-containing protein [Archangium violaceum]QRK09301.1 hypothetical protein JQX13_03895 [Archangium violaceum]
MRPLLDEPFALFGASMGGIIAFELARWLRAEWGMEPAHLFIAASSEPQVPNPRLDEMLGSVVAGGSKVDVGLLRRFSRDFYRFYSPANRRTQKLLFSPVLVPTLALTGAKDGCARTQLFDRVNPKNFPKGLRTERIQDAGHLLHQEKPAEVNRLLVEWLGQHRG